jgi:3-deoxy-7-phosphoheptulonate synthase
VETSGNPFGHAILRGALDANGKNIPNYHYEDLLEAAHRYQALGLQHPFILVDTNHDNSGKKFAEQIRIVRETLTNRSWNPIIHDVVRGFMIESYLEDGRQDQPEVFGQSITDPCLGWEKTESLVREIYQYVAE